MPAAEYLSGNVRTKLTAATAAVVDQPHLQVNVDALTAVVPPDLQSDQIAAKLGAPWIPVADIQQFLRETFEEPTLQVVKAYGNDWEVKGSTASVHSTVTWGTARVPGPRIAEATLEQRQITVYDEWEEAGQKRRVLNMPETIETQQKATDLNARFGEWAWDNPERAARLTRIYNDTFNSIVLRNYDVELSLPGLSANFIPRPHQIAAVARMINEPAVGLFHEVGAGKTAEMVMGCMELRRLGLVNKPAIVVPNHMLDQFTREFLQLYPQAKILAAGKDDLVAAKRREFVARCATGDWDAIIMTRSAFGMTPLSPDAQRGYLNRELDGLRSWLGSAEGSETRTVKRMQASLTRAEERLKAKNRQSQRPRHQFREDRNRLSSHR